MAATGYWLLATGYWLLAPSDGMVYILYIPEWLESGMRAKQSVFTMKLEPELRDEFMAEAEAAHRPASQIVRELMREYVQRQREAREYEAFLRGKVDTARRSMRSGEGLSDSEVEAQFAARRAQATEGQA
jgi:predicted transcriptional regulator